VDAGAVLSDARATCAAAIVALAACGGEATAPTDAITVDASSLGAEVVFDETALRTFELEVAPADWQELQDNAQAEQYVPATLRYDGGTYGPIGLRYKGGYGTLALCFDGSGNRTCPKLSMKLKFDEYVDDLRFYGLKKLNLHSMVRDPSHLHDRLAYAVYRDAGVAAPRAVHGRLVINGELQGVFAVIEEIDGRFARDRFGADGNVYKEVWPVGTAPGPYEAALVTNEDLPDVDRMVRFAAALAAADDTTFRATLEAWMDVPTLARYLAADRLVDAWDGIVAWYVTGGPAFNHNYYWYEDPGADRMTLVPWDMDNSMEVPSPIRTSYGMPDWHEAGPCAAIQVLFGIQGMPPNCDPLIGRLSRVLWDDYAAATRELLDGPATLAALEARLDAARNQLRDAVAEDPNGPGSATWENAAQQLRDELPLLRARVEAQITR